MAIEKRISKQGTVSYRARLRLRSRGDVSSTHQRLTDARDWEARMKTAIRGGALAGSLEAQRHTAREALERYLALLPSLQLKDEPNRRRQTEWWKRELGNLPLSELTPARIASARDRLQTTPIVVARADSKAAPRYRKPGTVVRYLAALSHALTVAVEDWAWLESNPVRKVRKPKEPRGRVRYLTELERVSLLAACRDSTNLDLYPAVVIAIATGMRKSEILCLRWWQVDLNRGLITLEDTKNGERRQIPLLGHALEIVCDRSTAPHRPLDYVFPGAEPNKPRSITKAWERAIAATGIVDFRFHDLRHTTASYLAMRGASLLEIGEVLGQKSPQMTKRYSHLSVAHTRKVLLGMVSEVLPTSSLAVQENAPARSEASME
jgi:integrase